LPFSPEQEHALYLSFFIRCLLELGKERDLDFYLRQIECLYEKWKSPDLAYQLAEVYCLGQKGSIAEAKRKLEVVIADRDSAPLHFKAKIFLAYCYDVDGSDVASCRKIIDSISDSSDSENQIILELWRAKVLRDEGKLSEAEAKLSKVFQKVDSKNNWYAYFSATILLAGLYIMQDRKTEAARLVDVARQIVKNSPFRTVRAQLEALEKKIVGSPECPTIHCEKGISSLKVTYDKKTVELDLRTAVAKLIQLFTKADWVEKSLLSKALYKKEYVSTEDDSRIHSQIHTLRKFFIDLGLSVDPIHYERGGYRWLPKIEMNEA
jgi:tetratricopeptide (TPR) repeat protein